MAYRPQPPTKSAHDARVAETLRANLQRRKAQARSRGAMAADGHGPEDAERPADAEPDAGPVGDLGTDAAMTPRRSG